LLTDVVQVLESRVHV